MPIKSYHSRIVMNNDMNSNNESQVKKYPRRSLINLHTI